jgi:hypothetical protein
MRIRRKGQRNVSRLFVVVEHGFLVIAYIVPVAPDARGASAGGIEQLFTNSRLRTWAGTGGFVQFLHAPAIVRA